MATKVIKEIVTDVGGNTTIEYSDDTTQKYNVADVVTAQVNPLTGGITESVGNYSRPKKRVAIGIIGQSNERGQVLISQKATYPQCFVSASNSGFRTPIRGTLTNQGSLWVPLYDVLWQGGYEMACVNQARGSASIIKHFSGQVTYRNNSSAYRQKRDSIGNGDRGDVGDICVMGGKVFQCTTGNKIYLQYAGNQRLPGSLATWLDYVETVGALNSAASDPGGWSSATLGSTIVDGGITWTCIDASNAIGFSAGMVFTEVQSGLGFDPYGLMLDLHQQMQEVQDADEKIIVVCNAQSDTSATAAWYQASLASIANFYTSRGYKVLLGLSCYNTNNGIDRTAAYTMLTTGLEGALAALGGDPLVKRGANLYSLMGIANEMSWASSTAGTGWLQSDGVHLNAAGAIVAGTHWANAVKLAIAP